MRIPIRTLAAALCASAALAHADVIPASLFRDHAVLQQGMPIPVWGAADDGEKVSVTLDGKTVSTVAKDGKWSVKLDPMTAGGPYTLTIKGNNEITLSDILIGEVWVCSGQSNMERQLGLRDWQQPIKNWEAEAASANFPQIRHFGTAQTLALEPQEFVDGEWLVCSPETAPQFTAVGFFFGRALHQARGVPIGLIHSSWGGTPAEAWTSPDGIKRLPQLADTIKRLEWIQKDPEAARAEYHRDLERWFAENDSGTAAKPAWNGESLDTETWSTMNLPVMWENAGLPNYNGIVWFRREIDVPAAWTDQEVDLHLGAIDDVDTTWVNGRFVGGDTTWNKSRVYRIPADTLKAGRNSIAVRVLDTGGGGGIWGGDAMQLVRSDDPSQAIALDGEWRYRTSELSQNAPYPPTDPSMGSGTPTVLHNGMIAPLQPYAIRGTIWYQGEANAPQSDFYRELFPNMVEDWRRGWDQGDFPFLYVQIAPFKEMPPEIREAQRLSLDRIPNSAMAVTLDVGDADDIHPTDKRPVGERLALAARALAYGEKLEYSGPLYQSFKAKGKRAVLRFSHLGGGLVAKNGPLIGFTIAGPDNVFHPAQAKIVGKTVVVTSDEVSAPTAVRYAWANVPEGNLYNEAGLPASPFATDSE
ncbi:sialate O-acetylesterase [Pelagicoccus sp. SDUM812003]|uniref:sialate O-acetylesterase n=1 Tax=Pelagicoccus sp. SDUM812003 TaxID=3041267 RepID=UPI00280E1EAC|nr:sialate O-acetylesterase [Pelagicoccus sp. SDUM812003]MDQ8202153.1 sialate O-acetylesterase [Pelagicoccus sp. SDUM812003]